MIEVESDKRGRVGWLLLYDFLTTMMMTILRIDMSIWDIFYYLACRVIDLIVIMEVT